MAWLGWFLGGVLALGNAALTVSVFNSDDYDPRQKRLQALIIWLLPILGALLVWAIGREARREDSKSKTFPETLEGGGSGYDYHVQLFKLEPEASGD